MSDNLNLESLMHRVAEKARDAYSGMDQVQLVSLCTVHLVQHFSSAMMLQLGSWKGTLRPAKLNQIGGNLTAIMCLIGVLVDVLGLVPPDLEAASDASFDLPDTVQNDGVLAGMAGIQAVTYLVEDLFANDAMEAQSGGLKEVVDALENGEEGETLSDLVANVIVYVVVLANIHELDMEALLFNMTCPPKGIDI
jgi:hypothetical protein